MALVETRNLHAGYNGNRVLQGVSLAIETGQRWAVIGRNGVGKSTLVKAVAALLEPAEGAILVKDKNVMAYSARERARMMAYVPQKLDTAIPYTVHDFVMLGRYAAMGLWNVPTDTDHKAVSQALEFCDVSGLVSRMMTTLSGGELQRVLLAGALAQQAPILLLDEPTTFLDPAHERLFFRALGRAHDHWELTIVMVTHDINTALTSCTHVCALMEGVVRFSGDIGQFREKCPEILADLYGIPFGKYVGGDTEQPVFGTWEAQ